MTKKITTAQAIEAACKIAGSQAKLAKHLGLTSSNISQWRISKKGVPERHCQEIENLTGVKCEMLNPTLNWKYLRKKE